MLYLVATPIGNLADISQRALDTLRAVDLIASEDTRHTGKLLHHFGIDKPQVSFHEHNERREVNRLIEQLRQGKSIALVSDAGTPSISDPGYILVRAAIEHDIAVTMIPGASACIMALALSGLPSHAFTFRGFPPRKSGQRQRFFAVDGESPHTLIFYESVYRIADTLQDALAVYGDRRAALANDLTKMFEHVERGTLSELISWLQTQQPKGEYVLVVEGKTEDKEREFGMSEGD